MSKKFLKTVLSVILALSVAVMPNTAYAKATATQPQGQYTNKALLSQSDVAKETKADNSDKTDSFAATKKLAESKAATLTTMYGVTSVQYALIDDGKITVSGVAGVYDKNSSIPLTSTNMYGIGSISKIFTTVAVLQLAEQGKVNLDAPVKDYIPEFTMADPRYKDITVRMLLNHSSGLMGSTLNNSMLLNDNDSSTYDDFLNILKTSRLKANPGEFSVYCNDGFTLAQVLVEKVTKTTFTDYIKKNISEPLNLYNTKTPKDDFNQNRLSRTYVSGSNLTLPADMVNMIGAGGIYSSAENLCEFATIFMDNSKSSVLSRTSAKSMENSEYLKGLWPENKPSTITYGLGWDSVYTYPFEKYGIKALTKGGDTSFYHGSLIVLPENNMAAAVLSSGGASTYNQVLAQEILLSALKEKGVINEILPDVTYAKPVAASMPDSLKQYAGYYGFNNGTMKISISDDGTLTVSNALTPDTGTEKFIYTGEGKFYYTDGSTYITFVNANNGNTYLYVSGYVTLPGLGQTVSDEIQGQKIEANTITDEIKSAWKQRLGKRYVIINEKYTSSLYVTSSLFSQFPNTMEPEGYFITNTITDANTALAGVKIPGTMGRDLMDYTFYKEGKTEYLKAGSYILISEDSLSNLPASSLSVDISGNKYAQWYKIGKNTAGKKIKVKVPDKGSFTVYDSNGSCVLNSYVSKQNTVTLPKGGYIVFAGDAKAHFEISYVK